MLVGFWWLLLVLLWPQLCPRLCPCAVAAARRDRKGQKELPELPDTSLGNSEERPQLPEPAEPRITDPRRTWISFVHRPDDGSGSKRRCKGRDKKLRGLVGPPGPPGPQGPPGAPGAEVTKEILLQEFKEILKETIEHRASLALPAQPSPLPLLPLALAEAGSQRRLLEAFHCKLKGHVLVDKKTLVELQNFQLSTASCGAERRCGHGTACGCWSASSPCATGMPPWKSSLAWRATAKPSPFVSRACCSCRLASTPPSSWTTVPAPPSPSRAALISWECCWEHSSHPKKSPISRFWTEKKKANPL
ncbi:adipolin isoform X4 [Taeniopygia guttata]|uniref:adipolin isoform X4 n=1 Tax=Taeniopygia guttata TaxID=59729 RepID=UPI003BB94DBD